MSVFHGKLLCLSKPLKVAENWKRTLTYCEICQFFVHYKFMMVYSTDPLSMYYKTLRFTMYRFHSWLVCLFKTMKLTDNSKKTTYFEICFIE